MAITLRPITERNWETAARLEVTEEQRHFIASNLWSIAESHYQPELVPLGIYRGGTMVGFLMYGRHPEDGEPWLVRFMIAPEWQRQGLGREALRTFLDRVRDEGFDHISVGWHPDNDAAAALYREAGFRDTGMASWGELTGRWDATRG